MVNFLKTVVTWLGQIMWFFEISRSRAFGICFPFFWNIKIHKISRQGTALYVLIVYTILKKKCFFPLLVIHMKNDMIYELHVGIFILPSGFALLHIFVMVKISRTTRYMASFWTLLTCFLYKYLVNRENISTYTSA